MLLFDVGEYKKAFEILKFFEDLEYGNYKPMYGELYRCLSEFLNGEADLE